MSRYTVLIDGEAGAYGAAFPDCPGCMAMGATVEATLAAAAEALREWVDDIETAGAAVPEPRSLEALRHDPEVAGALAEGALLATAPLVRTSGRPVKANLSIDAGILAAIDAEAARRRLTRSAFVELLAKEGIPALS